MMAMLEWRLYPFTPTPDQPKEILRKWRKAGRPTAQRTYKQQTKTTEKLGPAKYDNHYDPQDGNHTRKA